jgi:hypothetical protein
MALLLAVPPPCSLPSEVGGPEYLTLCVAGGNGLMAGRGTPRPARPTLDRKSGRKLNNYITVAVPYEHPSLSMSLIPSPHAARNHGFLLNKGVFTTI